MMSADSTDVHGSSDNNAEEKPIIFQNSAKIYNDQNLDGPQELP